MAPWYRTGILCHKLAANEQDSKQQRKRNSSLKTEPTRRLSYFRVGRCSAHECTRKNANKRASNRASTATGTDSSSTSTAVRSLGCLRFIWRIGTMPPDEAAFQVGGSPEMTRSLAIPYRELANGIGAPNKSHRLEAKDLLRADEPRAEIERAMVAANVRSP